MKVIGFRLSNSDYTYAILEGSKSSPKVLEKETIIIPKGYSRPQIFRWLYQDFKDLLRDHNPKVIAYKKTEGLAARDSKFVSRIQYEGLLYLVATEIGVKKVVDKVKSSIAKDLGYKGKAHYLKPVFIEPPLKQYYQESDKIKEAILVALSELD